MVKQFWEWLFNIVEICLFKKELLGYVSWKRIETTKKIEIAYSVTYLRTLWEILSPFPRAQSQKQLCFSDQIQGKSLEELKLVGIFPFAFFCTSLAIKIKPFFCGIFQKWTN